MEFLPVSYIEDYVKKNPNPLTELGEFTYIRTYSRWLDHRGRREFWHETVKRAIEYNMSLEYGHMLDLGFQPDIVRMSKEAKKLFENIYNARQMPSGRTLWLGNGNVKINKEYPSGNFNCSFTNIEKWEDLAEVMYLLSVGTGVGLKSTLEMAKKMPKIRTDFTVINKPYEPLPENLRDKGDFSKTEMKGRDAFITVSDSKEGWVTALTSFFNLLTKKENEHIEIIHLNYNNIRPKGERLKTFGGTASGAEPLVELFEGIHKVLNNQIDTTLEPIELDENGYGHPRPIHVLDIANMIGNTIVVGGVRRSAEIFLFDPEDYESMFAKYGMNGIWTEDQLAQHKKVSRKLDGLGIKPKWFDDLAIGKRREGIDHRRMSNNSIGFIEKPSREQLDLIFEMMQMEGEPGFVNLGEAARRVLATMGVENPTKRQIKNKAYELGLNPCVEIILHSKNVCNLTTVNVSAFVKEDNTLDLEGLLEAQRMSARIGLRMTLVELELPEWNKVQQRDRLLGTSLTGWKDAIDKLGYTEEQENELKKLMGDTSREAAQIYAKQLRVNAPMFTTAVKPEGTLSQVMGGVSSGLHWSHSPHYIRRIRINSEDPLLKVAQELEWDIHAEVGTNNKMTEEELSQSAQLESARTMVVSFPVASGAKRTKDDISVDEQFDNYFSFQDLYTDMNTSNTITVKVDEWEAAQQRVWDGWDNFVGVSFLSHDGGTYTLAPYEAISKEEYEERKENMAPFDAKLLLKYEKGETDTDLENMDSCEGGVCPIR